eukprot:TRINITY_DN2112_c0_g2_i2.p1 TRINITY_DN2112_c0_g2~~TRINITY_DN2112_c0_g2_i2.p1  ORF type:complete len:700 (-),score=119.52 TRINITY_DN2112_c0_g2_i2:286-2385(-)
MSAPSRKRVRTSFSCEDSCEEGGSTTSQQHSSGTAMLPEEAGGSGAGGGAGLVTGGAGSSSGEHSTRKAMRIQKNEARASMSPSARTSNSGTPPYDGVLGGYGGPNDNSTCQSDEYEGEYVPNSDVDPVFLRKIKTNHSLSNTDKEVVRLIGQHLYDLGLKSASDVLMKEAGCKLDDPSSATFRHCVMKGDWTGAVNVLEDLKHHLDSSKALCEMKFIILEQKYMEYIHAGKTYEALKVLQLELSPLKHNTSRTHQLSSYLMLPGPGFNNGIRLPTSRASDANSVSSRTNSLDISFLPSLPLPDRGEIMEKLQAFFPPTVMLPPRRLRTLLSQAVSHQRNQCVYHNSTECASVKSYAVDHMCSKETFPCETIQVLLEHNDEVWFCKWAPNGRYLATGSKDCTVIIWKFDPKTLKLTNDKVLEGHSQGVSFFAWSPDSTKLAVCGPEDSPEVFVFDIPTGRLDKKLCNSQEDSLTTVAWAPNGMLTAGSNKGQFYQFDCMGSVLNSWEGVRVQCLAQRSDGRTVLAADTHHRLRSYNFDDLTDETIIQEDNAIMSFTIDQTDRYALLNIASSGAHLWDINEGCLVQKLKGITQGYYTIYSSFGGLNQSFVASGSEDTKVYIYHVNRADPIQELTGHTRTVSCVSWNPVYHQVLVSASDDQTVRVWAPAEKYRNATTTASSSNPSSSSTPGGSTAHENGGA